MLTLPFGWNMNKTLLVFFNALFGVVLIALSFTEVLSLDLVNFLFFSFVGLLFALYRPGWAFLFLIGMLPYEVINIAPENFSLMIRPYQWILVLLTAALAIRFFFKRPSLPHFTPSVWDGLLVILGASSLISALASADQPTAFKLSIVLFSFILLYFICRLFLRNVDDIVMLLPFLLSSFLVVACYAVVQNILFLSGRESLEVMAGRPNATFAEADWLGGYLAIMIVMLGAFIASPSLVVKYFPLKQARALFSALLFFGFVALILSVSRSAWLAALAGIVFVLLLSAWQNGAWNALRHRERAVLREILHVKLFLFLPLLLAVFLVQLLHMSPFDLLDRSRSVASGDQKITVACERSVILPEKIESLESLRDYGCEHILLEERGAKESTGAYVTEVFRSDPNVNIRLNIYGEVSHILAAHPVIGIGFGVISAYLGTDDRGSGLNASNIFLEIWLGAGIIGFSAFVLFWCGLGIRWIYRSCKERSPLGLVLGAVFLTATAFNLFNSGLFLSWLFFYLAILLVPEADSSTDVQ